MKHIEATVYHRTSRGTRLLAYTTAFILLVMALMQLFDFEKTREAFRVLLPATMEMSVLPLMSLVVIMEVFALPYFLPVPLSRLARWCALGCALAAPLSWLFVMMIGRDHHGANVPLLGSIVHIPLGLGSLLFVVVVLALVVGVVVRDRK